MIAIQTLYRPVTEKLGASIIARAEYGCSVVRKSIPYPYEHSPENAHRVAAFALIEKVNTGGGAWPTNIVTGCLPDASYCHVLQH
jgi:hypothetical protein